MFCLFFTFVHKIRFAEADSLSDLFGHLPKNLILENGVDLPEAISELEAIEYFESISQRNTQNLICFAGGGHYDVYLPHLSLIHI